MTMTGTTPPILQGPTSKEKKYDRQLRLWAASGQQALEEAHVLLVNSGPGVVGVETLKNLVLPGLHDARVNIDLHADRRLGIGNFTILDSGVVDEADLGVNFFLEDSHLGGFRAEHTCNLLKELNPDVQGHFLTEPVETFITQPDALRPYTLILVTSPIDPEILSKISLHANNTGTPVFYIHDVGFYSHFSLYLPPAFPIVDTHPDPASTTDLRLLSPWPELISLAKEKTKDLDNMSDHEHGHIPYVLLLLHYLEEWKATHDGRPPQNYAEKSKFKELVRAGARTNNPEGGEENYDEAVAAVLKTLNPPSASSAVKEVFSAPECLNLTPHSPSFWLIAHAISRFNSTHSTLPLPGAVPDMKAQSADYILLQNAYKSKARADVAEVLDTVCALEKQLSRSPEIPEAEIEAFCKNAAHIKLVRGRPFHVVRPGERVSWGERAKSMAGKLRDEESLALLYIAFLAYDAFTAAHTADAQGSAAQAPGAHDFDADAEKLMGIAHAMIDDLLNEAGVFMEEPEYGEVKEAAGRICREVCRAGGAELHNVAALTGGMVAQEVIKVVTKQYVPVDNTCLFDGVRSVSAVLRV